MTAHIIDGKALAKKIREELRADVESFKRSTGRPIGLATVLVGDDPASEVYVGSKRNQNGGNYLQERKPDFK